MLRAPPRPSEPAPSSRYELADEGASEPGGVLRHASIRAGEPPASTLGIRRVLRLATGRTWKVFLGAGLAGTTLLVVLLVSFGPFVRSRVVREGERQGLAVDVGRVWPGFFAVSMRDVRVRALSVPGIEARIDEVRVELGASLSVREVNAKGGTILAHGEPEEVIRQLREARAPRNVTSAGTVGSKRVMSASDISLSWKLPSGGELAGAGIRLSRDDRGVAMGCARCSARHRDVVVDVVDAHLELDASGVLRRATARSLDATYESSRVASAPTVATAASNEPRPPPLPTTARSSDPPMASPSAEPVLPLPDLHRLRRKIATATAVLADRLPDGGLVEVGGLSVRFEGDGERMAFGPGAFLLRRHGERIHLGFTSSPSDAVDPHAEVRGTPLSIDADLPLGAGEMVARLAGGPVSLATLGVKEGDRGIMDVSRGMLSGKGQLVLSESADALTFDGEVSLDSISIKQPRLAPEPMHGLNFSVSARGVFDDRGKLRVDDAQLDMGALHVRSHGTVEESADHFAIAMTVDVAPAACQALLDSAPRGLLPVIRSTRMAGTFGASVTLAFDTRTIDKLVLDYRVGDQCRMLEVPSELSRDRFDEPFTYRTYKPDGTLGETTTGPGSSNWTALSDISPFMISAVLTTEDGAFYRHHGFNHSAIRSSVRANLKARRFVRGASTITMQLAKNLFLAREKALSRKIEEVILADYLEQNFRKDDMLELYLNIVEFGPDVYGITHAADYYFGRRPEELHLAECFFLASLLPSPIRYGKFRDKGEVSESWMRHLKALMEIAAKNGKISNSELEEGLKESIVFVRPGDPRPEPRPPVTSTRRDPFEEDESLWRPLD